MNPIDKKLHRAAIIGARWMKEELIRRMREDPENYLWPAPSDCPVSLLEEVSAD